jgi:hypothetical protein
MRPNAPEFIILLWAFSINTAKPIKLLNSTQNVWASDLGLYLTGKFRMRSIFARYLRNIG